MASAAQRHSSSLSLCHPFPPPHYQGLAWLVLAKVSGFCHTHLPFFLHQGPAWVDFEVQAVSALLPAAGATSCAGRVGAEGHCGQPQCMAGGGWRQPAPGAELQCGQQGKGPRVGRRRGRGKALELGSTSRMASGQRDFPLTAWARRDLSPSLTESLILF